MATILDHAVVKAAVNTSQRLDHFKRIKEQLKQQHQAQSILEHQENAQLEDGGVVFIEGQNSSSNFTPLPKTNGLSSLAASGYGVAY